MKQVQQMNGAKTKDVCSRKQAAVTMNFEKTQVLPHVKGNISIR